MGGRGGLIVNSPQSEDEWREYLELIKQFGTKEEWKALLRLHGNAQSAHDFHVQLQVLVKRGENWDFMKANFISFLKLVALVSAAIAILRGWGFNFTEWLSGWLLR